jgi:hypothetical protein
MRECELTKSSLELNKNEAIFSTYSHILTPRNVVRTEKLIVTHVVTVTVTVRPTISQPLSPSWCRGHVGFMTRI